MGFSAEEVKVGNGSKYQSAGVSEKVSISEVILNHNEQYNTKSITLKTINENKQEGQSKRLSLTTDIKPGNQTSGWLVSAKSLLNILMSTGKSREEANEVLKASDEKELVKKLTSALVGKEFRGLFSSREYQPDKFAIELYTTETVGGTRLVWDPNNQYYVKRLPKATLGEMGATAAPSGANDLPF